MNTHAILRQLSQSLSLDIAGLQAWFAAIGIELSPAEVQAHLCDEQDPAVVIVPEAVLLRLLDKLIADKRGSSAAPASAERPARLSNNDVLKKLRIAFQLHEQDVRDLLKLVTIELTKSDLAALFRKAGQPHYKACDDELLLDFIQGLGLWLRQREQG